MKTIKFESNYGAFAYAMTAEVGENLTPATELLCLEGLANIGYRGVGSNVDKALGVKSKKLGGQGRDGVVYKEELKATIVTAVAAKIAELEAANTGALKPLGMKFEITGEHVKGAGSEPKFARERKKFVEKESSPVGLAKWLEAFAGYKGATHIDEAGTDYHPDALQAAKVAIDKFMAANI